MSCPPQSVIGRTALSRTHNDLANNNALTCPRARLKSPVNDSFAPGGRQMRICAFRESNGFEAVAGLSTSGHAHRQLNDETSVQCRERMGNSRKPSAS